MTLPNGLRLEPYDPRTASDAFIAALAAHQNALLHERQPDDPPILATQFATNWRHLPPFVQILGWVVRDGETIIAEANVALMRLEQNQHLAQADVGVRAPYRRRGIGRHLLRQVVDAAQADGRTTLLLSSNARVPGGEAALRRMGARPGLEAHVNQLDLAALDPTVLERWVHDASVKGAGHTVELWEGGIPEGNFDRYLDLMRVMNDQPLGDLDVEEERMTAEQLREVEAHRAAQGRSRVRAVARRLEDGRLVGFTDLSWHPKRPSILSQAGTGVHQESRGLGLGRWLKAAALQRALQRNPEARFVRTENADMNAAMRRINEDLGFKPYTATTQWQLAVPQAQAYLQGQSLDVEGA